MPWCAPAAAEEPTPVCWPGSSRRAVRRSRASASASTASARSVVSGLCCADTLALLGQAAPEALPIIVHDGYVGEGYSIPTDGMVEAVQMVARTEAMLLDPVYTGKAMAGVIDLVRDGRWRAGQDILFVHTGGAPVAVRVRGRPRSDRTARA